MSNVFAIRFGPAAPARIGVREMAPGLENRAGEVRGSFIIFGNVCEGC